MLPFLRLKSVREAPVYWNSEYAVAFITGADQLKACATAFRRGTELVSGRTDRHTTTRGDLLESNKMFL